MVDSGCNLSALRWYGPILCNCKRDRCSGWREDVCQPMAAWCEGACYQMPASGSAAATHRGSCLCVWT